jgi:Reverse transcriptase (RNA-dependent DNA polymerase)
LQRGAENTTEPEPRRTQAKHIDYAKLQDPFSDEEAKDQTIYYTNAVELDANPITLKEAKTLVEWPEWEGAIKAELDQLSRMGTWRMVKKPANANLIANKWVFTKKQDKSGAIIKYKARLVMKGYAQRLGYDYNKTHSPVICFKTIRAILAMVPSQNLRVQQMDIKGAYLNGTLKEQVYMRQPKGYDNNSGRVCLLVKTLYSLKQSGYEWNIELDSKLQGHGYKRLKSDPCTYVQCDSRGATIIIVWVNDLLMFATTDEIMEEMKQEICLEWRQQIWENRQRSSG